ncbi:MAG TPA: transporter substrate-binding domain-containing protein [Methanospirillum sp.]|nr:transporter substrate-binding domain-containing protein [Methanospirillum sp.]
MDNKHLLYLILAGALMIAGCLNSAPRDNISVNRPVYVVGIDAEYPPYSYMQPDGNATGIDVESVRWIADTQGFDVIIRPIAWDGIIPALQAGTIDMIYSGMTITEDRRRKVEFTIPYWNVNQAVAVNNISSWTMEDFHSGKLRIGAQRGTTGAIWVEKNLVSTGKMPASSLVQYDLLPLAADDLANRRIDAMISSTQSLIEAIGTRPCRYIGEIETHEYYGVAVRKNDTELLTTMNEGLSQFLQSPEWMRLKEKYRMI